jgi:hypothetical protein
MLVRPPGLREIGQTVPAELQVVPMACMSSIRAAFQA